MVFHNVFDILFSTWSNIAVMRVLQHYSSGITGREIARLSGINHRTSQKALATLEGIGVVLRQRGGRDHQFVLNRDHVLVAEALTSLLRFEKEFFKKACSFIAGTFSKHSVSIILFGSVARKDETTQSDFDVCIVVKNAQQYRTVEELTRTISSEFRKKYGANLALFIIAQKDFSSRAKKKQSPITSIIKEGMILGGKSLQELMHE
jgi:predicted nucleotidyltransferase